MLVYDATTTLPLFCQQGQEVRLRSGLERRLGPAQQEALCSNYALLLSLAGRADAARDFATATLARCACAPPRTLAPMPLDDAGKS